MKTIITEKEREIIRLEMIKELEVLLPTYNEIKMVAMNCGHSCETWREGLDKWIEPISHSSESYKLLKKCQRMLELLTKMQQKEAFERVCL